MATRIVPKVKQQVNITYTTKPSIKKRLAYATGFVSFGIIASMLQFHFIHNNSNMKDNFLMSGVIVERDETKELKVQIEGYKKEIEKLNNDNQAKSLTSRGDINRSLMYDYTKLSAPKEISEAIYIQCKSHGFDNMDEIYPIVAYESEFNPKARTLTKHEDSRGLLQVNTITNYPKNLDKNKLYDANYNLDYQLDELYSFYKLGKSKGLVGVELSCWISRFGQRPLWTDAKTRNYIVSTINKYYKEIIVAKIK